MDAAQVVVTAGDAVMTGATNGGCDVVDILTGLLVTGRLRNEGLGRDGIAVGAFGATDFLIGTTGVLVDDVTLTGALVGDHTRSGGR